MRKDYSMFTRFDFEKAIRCVCNGPEETFCLGSVQLGALMVHIIAEGSYDHHSRILFKIYVAKNDDTDGDDVQYDEVTSDVLISVDSIEAFDTYEDFQSELLASIEEHSKVSGYRDNEGHSLWDLAQV